MPLRTALTPRRLVTNARRLLVAVAGGTLGLLGLALIPLPGPGLLVSVVGLAVLATEFAWAARALHRTTALASNARTTVNEGRLRRIAVATMAAIGLAAGLAVAVGVDRFRAFGIAAVVTGAYTLAMLTPAAGRWLERALVRLTPATPSPADAPTPEGATR